MLRVWSKAALMLTALFTVATMVLSGERQARAIDEQWQVVLTVRHPDTDRLVGYIMDVDGRNIEPLMWKGEQIAYPACSSGGHSMAFIVRQTLFVIDVTEGRVWQWNERIDTPSYAEIGLSDNGQIITFNGTLDKSGKSMWIINTASSQTIMADTIIERVGRSFVVSPDGRQTAFVSYIHPSAIEDIYLSTAERHYSTKFITNALFPNWSPDGTMLTFVAGWAGAYDVYLMDVGRQLWVQITHLKKKTTAVNPAWSPDGNHLVFIYYDGIHHYQGEINLIGMASENHFPQPLARYAVSACFIRNRPYALYGSTGHTGIGYKAR